jgi:Xaa-Pro dipeptidase
MNLSEIQSAINDLDGDGWLFYDIHHRDKIAYKILGLNPSKLTTRRWYYYIPVSGQPQKFTHRIESERLDELPGVKNTYMGWKDLHEKLHHLLGQCKTLFMQYSPNNNIPLVSYADAGTVELIRSFGIKVNSSATLIQMFEARLTEKQIELHKIAGNKIYKIKDRAFEKIANAIRSRNSITEYEVQSFILERFDQDNLTCDGIMPLVAVNSHAASPHFEVTVENSVSINKNDRVLIDLWARENVPNGIYYDITWCGYMGTSPPDIYSHLFRIVVNARKRAKDFIIERIAEQKPVQGWEVDDICRSYIAGEGYGDYFLHRTGHSIHTQVHGNGVNIDNLETKDDRDIIPGSCFSIEPGIYKGDIGVRSEINVLLDYNRNVVVVGEEQENLICMN